MKKEFAHKVGEKLSLPPEALGEIPLTQIRGNCSLSIENHRGILEYDEEVVKVSVKHGAVAVRGHRLKIVCMSSRIIEIRGCIRSVELE